MHKEGVLGVGLMMPVEQFCLIGVGREATNGVDTSPHLDFVVEETHLLGAIDNLPRQSSVGGIPNLYDAGLLASEVFAQMVAYPTTGTHASAGHNDRPFADTVNSDRFRCFAGEMESGQLEGVTPLTEQFSRLAVEHSGWRLKIWVRRDGHG